MHLQIPLLLQVMAGHSGLVVSAHDCAGSNLTAGGCVYRDGHCDMQSHRQCTFTAVPGPTQPCIPPWSQNRVPSSAWVKGGNVTSAGWHVTQCDPI